MEYLMLSTKHYMGNGYIVEKASRRQPCKTLVPSYFWKSGEYQDYVAGFTMQKGDLVNVKTTYEEVKDFTVGGIRIKLTSDDLTELEFKGHAMSIQPEMNLRNYTVKRRSISKLLSIDYHISFDGAFKDFHFDVDATVHEAFKDIRFCAHMSPERGVAKSNEFRLSYGLQRSPYTVKYLNRELSGQCYAWVFGSWAILLQDDLSFDALVLLNGCNSATLSVSKFIYTENIYLIKVISLWKAGR